MMTVFVLNRIENERARAAVGQRYWTPLLRVETGGATPGRGGRRKRARRWRFGITDDFVMALAEYDPPVLGYRERRRRAKRRRRRARAAERPEQRRLAEAARKALWRGFMQGSEWVKNRLARTV